MKKANVLRIKKYNFSVYKHKIFAFRYTPDIRNLYSSFKIGFLVLNLISKRLIVIESLVLHVVITVLWYTYVIIYYFKGFFYSQEFLSDELS